MRRRGRTTRSAPPLADWRSYDSVAETYERVRAPSHEAPARDLVAAVTPPVGGRVLDVGTGTGTALIAAGEAVGPTGLAVGVDRSPGMLGVARTKGLTRLAAAEAVDLPFPDASFDAVIANFVVFHFTQLDTALFDMIRVLRPGGRLGVTTWSGPEDEFSRTWRQVAESLAGVDILRDAAARATPWREHLGDPARLESTLRDARLRAVEVRRERYRVPVTIEAYLAGRETSAQGRLLKQTLGETLWPRFQEGVEEAFRERFREPLGDSSDVLIAVGIKER